MSLPLSHAGGSVDGISAALDLRFASSLSLTSTSGITPSYSRASTGTYFNASGVLTSAAINGPRFDHVYNGTNWVSKGLLVEEQRTNLLIYSEQFDNAAWIKTGLLITANSTVAPDGTTTADSAIPNNALLTPQIYRILASSIPVNYSVFLKYNGIRYARISSAYIASGADAAVFDLVDGTISLIGSAATAKISAVGNGWYLCSVSSSSAGAERNINPQNSPSIVLVDQSYNGTSGIYIWGAQLEAGSFPTSYIPTTTVAVTRSADVCQITGGDFSGFWNASEGSFACEVNPLGGNTIVNQGIVTANDGTFSNVLGQIRNLLNTNGDYGAFCRASGTTTMAIVRAAGSTQVNVDFRVATGFKANDCADSLNGGAVITDSTVTLPTVNRLTIGDFHTGANTILNGHIARLRYFNKRLTNQQLEDLCKPEQQLKLDLNFSNSLSLTPTVGPTPSFSRASTGTYFNASGVLTSAAINAPRFDHVYNGTNWVSKGLLVEEQRTNLATYSEDFSNAAYGISGVTVLANQVAAPDGNTTADKLTMTSSGTFYQSPLYGSAGAQAGSVWLRADSSQTVMLRIANDSGGESTTSTVTVTTSWQRFSVARTFAANPTKIWFGIDQRSILGGPNVAATIYGWGYQIESGSFPTSYIPTTTAAVTRSADVCQITGGDFSSFWNASEGSFAVKYDRIFTPSSSANWIMQIDDGTNSERIGFVYEPSAAPAGDQMFVIDGGSLQARVGSGSFVSATPGNFASCYKLNDFAATLNGSALNTDTSGTLPTVNKIDIGRSQPDSNYLNGHIARLRYYAIRQSNANLRYLSGGSKSFQPNDLNGLQFWVDASDAATLYTDSTLTTLAVSDGDVVGGWKDKSGNSRNALQTDGTKKPLLKLAIQNGRNVVRYDGVNDFSLISTISIAQPYHVFFVTKIRSTGNIFHANGQGQIRTGTAGSISPLTGVTVFCGTPLASTNFFVNDAVLAGQFVANGASSKIYKDGSLVVSGNPGTDGITSTMTLASYNTGLNNLNSDFMELLVYNSELSGANRQLVEAYLKAKWGTP